MERKRIPDNLIFYDGDCGFCNSSVQFILSKKKSTFYFLPLQSIIAQELLEGSKVIINMDTIYLLKKGTLYDRSSAALQITKGLRGGYPLMFAFYLIPKFVRDAAYNFIAKRRHRIRNSYCLIPKEEDEQYFLKD